MFGRFFKNKEGQKSGPPAPHASGGDDSTAATGDAGGGAQGGGFFNLPPTNNPPPAYPSAPIEPESTSSRESAPVNQSGDMFGGMSLKQPSYAAPPSADTSGSLFTGLSVNATAPTNNAPPAMPPAAPSNPEQRRKSLGTHPSYNYMDKIQQDDPRAASMRVNSSEPMNRPVSRQNSRVKRKKKTFRPGFGRELSDETAAALQRGEIDEEELQQRYSGRQSSLGNGSDTSAKASSATDLAHLLPPVTQAKDADVEQQKSSVLAGLTVHDKKSPQHSSGVLAGLQLRQQSPEPRQAASPVMEKRSSTPKQEEHAPVVRKQEKVVTTPQDRLQAALTDFYDGAMSFREKAEEAVREENSLEERRVQLKDQLSQLEMDVKQLEAQQQQAVEQEDFEKADAIDSSLGSARHRVTLAESDLRQAENEAMSSGKNQEKLFATQLRSARGTLRLLEKLQEEQVESEQSLSKQQKEYDNKERQRMEDERKRVEGEMSHVQDNLEQLGGEQKEIQDTIESQCEDEVKERNQVQEEMDVVNDEIAELERQLHEKMEIKDALQVKLDAAEHEIDSVRSRYARQLQRLQDREQSLRKAQKEVEDDLACLERQQEEFSAKLDSFESQKDDVKTLVHQIRRELDVGTLLSTVLEKVEEKKSKVRAKKKTQSTRTSMADEELQAAQQSERLLLHQMEEMKRQLQVHENAIASATSMLPPLEEEKKQAAANRQFKEAAKLSKDIKALEKDKENAEEAVESTRMELEDAQDKLGKKKVETEEKQRQVESVKKKVAGETMGLLAELMAEVVKGKNKVERADAELKKSALLLLETEEKTCAQEMEELTTLYGVEKADVEVEEEEEEEIPESVEELEKAIEEATAQEDYERAARLDQVLQSLKDKKDGVEEDKVTEEVGGGMFDGLNVSSSSVHKESVEGLSRSASSVEKEEDTQEDLDSSKVEELLESEGGGESEKMALSHPSQDKQTDATDASMFDGLNVSGSSVSQSETTGDSMFNGLNLSASNAAPSEHVEESNMFDGLNQSASHVSESENTTSNMFDGLNLSSSNVNQSNETVETSMFDGLNLSSSDVNRSDTAADSSMFDGLNLSSSSVNQSEHAADDNEDPTNSSAYSPLKDDGEEGEVNAEDVQEDTSNVEPTTQVAEEETVDQKSAHSSDVDASTNVESMFEGVNLGTSTVESTEEPLATQEPLAAEKQTETEVEAESPVEDAVQVEASSVAPSTVEPEDSKKDGDENVE